MLRACLLLSTICSMWTSSSIRTAFADDSKVPSGKSFRIPPHRPEQSVPTFRFAKTGTARPGTPNDRGFRIELVAAEPLIRDPVAIDFDEFGRMYVVEFPEFNEYSFQQPLKKSGAIKLLQDADHDGRFETSTEFLTNVPFASAVICFDGGVFVGAAPDVLYCKDTNGDGKADVRDVVLTGFKRDFAGGGLLNSFRWGLDNRIHIATSFAGGTVSRPDATQQTLSVRSRGIRLNPRDRTFELTSGGGQHGLGMSDWGEKLLCSNVYPMLHIAYDDRYVTRNRFYRPVAATSNVFPQSPRERLKRISQLEPWRIERSRMAANASTEDNDENAQAGGRFTSSSGITIYRGDAWPEEYRGDVFVGEVANNLVFRAKLERRGLSWHAKRADAGAEFLASTDVWFRPVQFANAPDGNLYVVDMYRELIEGAAFVPRGVRGKIDPSSGTNRGRVYRIVSTNAKSNRPRRLPFAKATVNQLVMLLEHPNGWHRDTAARLIYERQSQQAVLPLRRLALTSKSPLARMHAMYALDGLGNLPADVLLSRLDDVQPDVRIHALRLAESVANDEPEVRAKLLSMINDANPRVRHQLAFSLGSFSGQERNGALAKLMRLYGSDSAMRSATQSSLSAGATDVIRELVGSPAFVKTAAAPEILDSLATQVALQNRKSDLSALIRLVQALPADSSQLRGVLLRSLFRSAHVGRQLRSSTEKVAVEKLLAKLIDDAFDAANDERTTFAARVDAVRALYLADFSQPRVHKLLQSLLEPDVAPEIQSAAIATLSKFDHDHAVKLILNSWPTLRPRLRNQAVEELFVSVRGTLALLDAIEGARISRSHVSRVRMTILGKHQDPEIRARITRIFAGEAKSNRLDAIQAYQDSLKQPGDSSNGKVIFKRVCAACHKLDGVGKSIGASLGAIGTKSSESVLANILDPNRDVKPKFVSYVLSTKSGRTQAGMIVEETANSITLLRTDETRVTVLQNQIESLRGTNTSFMPEGLEKVITKNEMADLLAYLKTHR